MLSKGFRKFRVSSLQPQTEEIFIKEQFMNVKIAKLIFFAIFLTLVVDVKTAFPYSHLSTLVGNIGQDNKNSLKYRLSEYEEGPCFYVKSDGSLYYAKTRDFFEQGEQVLKSISFNEFKQLVKKIIPNKKQSVLILAEDYVMFKDLKKYLNFMVEKNLSDRFFILPCCDLN